MSEQVKQVVQHPRPRCYFCGGEGPIETHHIVPRRYNGSDDESNLVDLCPTCHERLERLYDKRFYQELGVAPEKQTESDKTSIEQKQRIEKMKALVDELSNEHDVGAKIGIITREMEDEFGSKREVMDAINRLKNKGELVEVYTNFVKTT